MADELFRLLPERVKALLKNVIDTSVFTLIKFITAVEATNLIRYIFKEIEKKVNTWEERNERSRIWAVGCQYFSDCICSL